MDKKEGEVSRFWLENLLSHGAKNILTGTLYHVTDFGYRKSLCLRGLFHDFSTNFFCLQVQKHFVEEPSWVMFQKISDIEKVYG